LSFLGVSFSRGFWEVPLAQPEVVNFEKMAILLEKGFLVCHRRDMTEDGLMMETRADLWLREVILVRQSFLVIVRVLSCLGGYVYRRAMVRECRPRLRGRCSE